LRLQDSGLGAWGVGVAVHDVAAHRVLAALGWRWRVGGWGVECGVGGLVFGIWGLGFGVYGLGFGTSRVGAEPPRVQCREQTPDGLRVRVWGLRIGG